MTGQLAASPRAHGAVLGEEVNTSLRITCLGLPIDVGQVPRELEVVIPPPKNMERRPAAGMTLRGEYAQVLEALAHMGASWDAEGEDAPRITVKVVVERAAGANPGSGLTSPAQAQVP